MELVLLTENYKQTNNLMTYLKKTNNSLAYYFQNMKQSDIEVLKNNLVAYFLKKKLKNLMASLGV